MKRYSIVAAACVVMFLTDAISQAETSIRIDTPMEAPKWAVLERQLLVESGPACQEFYQRYYDDRSYVQCVLRWGADDGPDDAFENFNHWPELHALGADDEIARMFIKGHEGMIKQYTEAKTVETPITREGMYYKEFCAQSDWMHHGEGLQLFNRMGLSIGNDPKYVERAKRFAGFYMGEDPEAPNYDPQHRIIRSMLNGSRGPMLRKATALDWVGDPMDITGFVTVHRERTYKEMFAHYEEYTDVVGDNNLNIVATTLPMDAYLLTHDAKYKQWLIDYMDAWVDRMKQNHWILPSFVDLDGKIGGPEGKWWGNAYGWGFSPVNPVTGRRENRNRIPRAMVGFNNVLWVTGDQKYVDAWRNMMDSINSNARAGANGQKEYPSMYNEQGWYGWGARPWSVGAMEMWYMSMKPQDMARLPQQGWIAYLQGQNPTYPETALQRDIQTMNQRIAGLRADDTPASKRLSDNMMGYNPAVVDALIQLTLGGLPPGVDGGLLNARLRYFDPIAKRAGLPKDVGALVSQIGDTQTVVTLVNLNKTEERTLIVQGGAYGEHQITKFTIGDKSTPVNSSMVTITLQPGAGTKLVMEMKRYANAPTVLHPWQRS
ncbi:MAG TPA: hypothetical protein VHD56_19425 [Tepidisphaeraceae bacterium]|nr:hypothetical protein [Tepidisphaeraceae bacterium]